MAGFAVSMAAATRSCAGCAPRRRRPAPTTPAAITAISTNLCAAARAIGSAESRPAVPRSAMATYEKLTPPSSGTAIRFENGQPVEYGQPLFLIE